MNKRKQIILWTLAFLITILAACYQRITGPTYPKKGNIAINGETIKYKLLRSNVSETDAEITLKVPTNLTGKLLYRKYRSNTDFTELPMKQVNGTVTAFLPSQPPAGKLEYYIVLNDGKSDYKLEPAIIRFKGDVPLYILIPHIFFMFFAMLMSTRTGIEAIANGKKTINYTVITIVCLFSGGLILGPIVQKYAFGEYWTGWPFGGDWTDNKTIIAFAFWVLAFFVLNKKPKAKLLPIIATLVLFAVYMIPHSLGGSELNNNTGKINTGLNK